MLSPSRLLRKGLSSSSKGHRASAGFWRSISSTKSVPLIIDGKDVHTENTFDVISPVTGQLSWTCSGASQDHVISTIDSAESAFTTWGRTKYAERRDIFLQAADVMNKRRRELGDYMYHEIGANQGYQDFILGLAIEGLKDTAGRIAGACQGTVPESLLPGMRAMVLKRPYGVQLGIAPWYVIVFKRDFGPAREI